MVKFTNLLLATAAILQDVVDAETPSYIRGGVSNNSNQTNNIKRRLNVFPWIEDFDLPDGTTSDAGATAWTATRSGGGVFEVRDGQFLLNDNGNEGVLETADIDVSAVNSVDVSLYVYSVALGDGLENKDYVKFYFVLDNGSEVEVGSVKNDIPNGETLAGTVDTSAASIMKLVVRGKVSFETEHYYLDNLSATVPPPPVPTPAPTPPPTDPHHVLPWTEDFAGLVDGATSDAGDTAWTATRSGGVFEVRGGEFLINDGGDEGVLESELLSVSNAEKVIISVDVRTVALGDGLENTDYVEVYYVLNNIGNEVLLDRVDDDIVGTITIGGTVDVSAFNSIKIVVRGKVSFVTENFYVDSISVVSTGDETPAPVTPAPITTSPVTPAPVTTAPVTRAPVPTGPKTSAPVAPSPETPAPVTPISPAPVTQSPVTPAPVTPSPVTAAPVTTAPVTPAPVTPTPVTPSPATPAPDTPAPATPAPLTPAPATPAPVGTPTLGIIGMRLIYAPTNEVIEDLDISGGVTVIGMTAYNLATLSFSVQAVVSNDVDQVTFKPSGKTEGVEPYAYCGDSNGDYNECGDISTLGTHTVTVSTSGYPDAVATFTIVEDTGAPTMSAPPSPAPTTGAPSMSSAPTKPIDCSYVPQLVGNWVDGYKYPISVAESHGVVIDNHFCILSGFINGFGSATEKSYCIDTQGQNANWVAKDDILSSLSITSNDLSEGISHAGFAVVGSKAYMCGGYLGGHPGPAIEDCLIFDPNAASGSQWAAFTSLPDLRAGGALLYNEAGHELIFSAGADRPNPGVSADAIDYKDTWTIDLSNPAAVWMPKDDLPYGANHISFATATASSGKQRFFVMGGQEGEDEYNGNFDHLTEYYPNTGSWSPLNGGLTQMLVERGHASSSTIPYGCGFLIMAGSTNSGKTNSIHYYNIETDVWYDIGNLPAKKNTPVCVIYPDANGGDDWLLCESPKSFSETIQIKMAPPL